MLCFVILHELLHIFAESKMNFMNAKKRTIRDMMIIQQLSNGATNEDMVRIGKRYNISLRRIQQILHEWKEAHQQEVE